MAGVDLDYCVWWDPAVRWDRYDLVVIRSAWDYVPRLTEYRRWLRSVDRLGTLRNPAPLVEWNIDKHYLLDLTASGVPIIPTRVARTNDELEAVLGAHREEVVVKPVISAGSMDTGRFDPDDPRAEALGRRTIAGGTPVMVQPAVSSVGTDGEVSAVVFRGEVSHSFRKGPLLALGGGLREQAYEEQVAPEALSAEQTSVAQSALDAVNNIASHQLRVPVPPLYARVDMVQADDGRSLILEVELNEPSFFLSTDSGAAEKFVSATLLQVGE